MRILVTGGNGFIGSHICDVLNELGLEPVVFDRRKNKKQDPLLFYGDLNDRTSVFEAIGHCDAFIHLAAILGTQETIDNPIPCIETNILGSINLLDAAAQYKVPGAYIAVGNHFMDNPYAITKSTIERFVRMYNAYRGTQINIVRAVNAYGPRQVPPRPYGPSAVRKIMPTFISKALRNEPIEIYGDGQQVSDMVYVGDVAMALVNAMIEAFAGKVFNEVIEVGPIVHNTVEEVAKLVIELTNSRSELKYIPMRKGEIPNAEVTANYDTLRLIGMSPDDLVPLREGMQATVNYYSA